MDWQLDRGRRVRSKTRLCVDRIERVLIVFLFIVSISFLFLTVSQES